MESKSHEALPLNEDDLFDALIDGRGGNESVVNESRLCGQWRSARLGCGVIRTMSQRGFVVCAVGAVPRYEFIAVWKARSSRARERAYLQHIAQVQLRALSVALLRGTEPRALEDRALASALNGYTARIGGAPSRDGSRVLCLGDRSRDGITLSVVRSAV